MTLVRRLVLSTIAMTRDRIILYGSLRRGFPSHRRLGLDRALRYLGPCRFRGRLYDLGRYPAFVPGPGIVSGQLFAVLDPSVIRRLDAFEGYDPASPAASEYHRVILRLRSPRGTAPIYRYAGSVAGRRPVPGGRWRKRLHART